MRAQATIQQLERRLRAVPAPPDAAHLRALLLAFVARENAIAGEVVQLATFIPAYRAALAPLAPASVALQRVLASKTASIADKAAALDRYGAALAPVIAKLRTLRPPPASRPVWAQQIGVLVSVRGANTALVDAMRTNRNAAIPMLLQRFSEAGIGNQTLSAQDAQIAAVVAYNRRVKSLNTLGSRISDEEARLQRSLG